MASKIWFITGAARGFGHIWAEAALARGDKVAATARNTDTLQKLVERYGDRVLPLQLDVTDSQQVSDAVTTALGYFGKLDVVLNNAGYALAGAIEEASLDEVKSEFDTNFFGSLRVIQAVLPVLRNQKSGHILGVSSVAGLVAGPITGFYNASKWAVEALHESLANEVSSFGIKVTLIEPGAYATDFSSHSSLKIAGGMDAYAALRKQIFEQGSEMEFGDPQATVQAILQIVDADQPPLRIFLGTEGMPVVRKAYATRLDEWEKWEELSNSAQGTAVKLNIMP
ncbi:SDR family NAD(P)-dependent oxidoreductase [Dickeya dadantii]|uniref:SDR family NAD(P)-dependent oxidoreductase n=1 Tax=Dickeya dadantii TaxID=204038 RepID=UPI001C0B0F3A|nr:SDR family NAD(P)-dependent oxidoreductase [Dickeya dadantii]QWT40219.1 SDR family NAD(P)-dependent oxidoreductase [Dickeya dadantii]